MLKSGDITYFVEDMRVKFGVVDVIIKEHGYAYVDFLELRDHRYVNGIPIDEFVSEVEGTPLPKGWTYSTDLFTVEERVPKAELERRKQLHWNVPEEVLAGIREGILVKSNTVFHGVVEAEISSGMYRVVKKYPHWTVTYGNRKREYTRVKLSELFATYKEAKAHLDALKEQRARELAMTDEEWSWQEINKVLRMVDQDYRRRCISFLSGLDDIWDVEIKKTGDRVSWRRFEKRTEWMPIC